MKHISFILALSVILALVLTFNSLFSQNQFQKQSKIFADPNSELFEQYRNTSSFVSYDSTALDSFIIAKMYQYHYPGLHACIVKNDSIIWKKNYGFANIQQNKLVTDSTLFYIASVSKLFTATAIMQLWEQGLFGLDDDVNDYLPFQVRNPNHPDMPITFRMLLTHTSSIHWDRNLITWGGDSPIELGYYVENYLTPGGVYYSSSNWNTWVPGTQYEYGSLSHALLGYLVEKISNMSFEQYCQDSIFVPLGMNETSWFLANLDIQKIATPYEYVGGNYNPNPHWGVAEYPGTQIRTSINQLARFIIAYIQKGQIDGIRILKSSTVDSMTTVHNPVIHHSIGLTWFMSQRYVPGVGDRIIPSHLGGWIAGANSIVGYILGTGENLGAAVSTNVRNDDGMEEIILELLSYGIVTEVEKNITHLSKNFLLSQNYPNPFNPRTTIEFDLLKTSKITLKVFNILGEEVTTLVSERLSAGSYTYDWDASNLASGVYLYRLQADKYVETKKMILLK
jgi:CubicO group peptidase (beta-lactamase class C family)